ncbi:Uncharacterized protein AXF42_Ash012963 [Apostasia shenzhenica]|uniref:Remorin C-terminal domain-containing protein n=1 Tax=Apostasia shenzhenica TaxID=1088818 RepID=A0A2I0ARS1_9ASPA|nr:Uncharacterized protein AXF42_Ash012963 [Apostasia shenzhenica]
MVAKQPPTAPSAAAEEINSLAIVPSTDQEALPPPADTPAAVTVGRTRREEVETKIAAWEGEELARIGSRFRRQKAIIDGWEGEQVEKANAWLKKVERKLEEKRARAAEKMRNEVAAARRSAAERRAEAGGRREEKVGRVMELARVMKLFGRDPSKRSFFKSI